MPFVRFSRDKRGYEHIYLVHSTTARGAPSRSRVLYWFRTPPGAKVGRQPFDAAVRAALDAQYPGLSFDWKTIIAAQPPPQPEAEPWRERRRAERSAKQARTAGRRDEPVSTPEPAVDERPMLVVDQIDEDGPLHEGDLPGGDFPGGHLDVQETGELAVATGAAVGEEGAGVGRPDNVQRPPSARARRRRRGGRRRTAADRPSSHVETLAGDHTGFPELPGATASTADSPDHFASDSNEPDHKNP